MEKAITQSISVFSTLLILGGVAYVGLTTYRGTKKGFYGALAFLIRILAAAFGAYFTAKLLAPICRVFFTNLVFGFDGVSPGEAEDSLPFLASLFNEGVEAFAAALLFFVFYPLYRLPARLLLRGIFQAKKAEKPFKGEKIAGGAVSFVAALLSLSLSLSVISGFVYTADGVTAKLSAADTAAESELSRISAEAEKIHAAIRPLASNPFLKISDLCAGFVFDGLCSLKPEGKKGNLQAEAETMANLYLHLSALLNEKIENYGPAQALALERAAATAEKSEIIMEAGAEILSYTAKRYKDKIDEGFVKKLASGVFGVVENIDGAALKEDLKETAALFKVLTDHAAFDLFAEKTEKTEVFLRAGFISGVFENIYAYGRFREIAAAFINAAFYLAAQSMGEGDADIESMYVGGANLPELDAAERRREALLIEEASGLILRFASRAPKDIDVLEADFASFGRALDIASRSRILEGKIESLIEIFLKSETVRAMGVFNEDTIREILSFGKSYESLMVAAQKAALLAKAATSPAQSAADAILWFSDDENKPFADAASLAVTEDLLRRYGVEKAAGNLTQVMGTYIQNLSKGKTFSPEEAATEEECLRHLFVLAKRSEKTESPLFGGEIPSGTRLCGHIWNQRRFPPR